MTDVVVLSAARVVGLSLLLFGPATALDGQLPSRLDAAEFAALIEQLSEPGGYFDTDNLVSNEDSYLHAVTTLKRHGIDGGAYIGVGPDQNFSYIAAVRPAIAFIVDIRRDNLLEHLLFKGIFAQAGTRLEYLCLLFGRPLPGDAVRSTEEDVATLLDQVTRGPPDSVVAARALRLVRAAVLSAGVPLSREDLHTLARFHQTFVHRGPDLRLTTFGRPERLDYPTLGDLITATDLEGRRASYLAAESDFQFVKSLQQRNLVIPLVGDFAGTKALGGLAQYLRQSGVKVSAFYTSNVEQYLFRDGSFDRFAGNVASLPYTDTSVIIRSYFQRGRPHPQGVPGFLSVQLLQRVSAFVAAQRAGGYRNYGDMVTRDVLR